MSASLVGSEMCIRDSFSPGHKSDETARVTGPTVTEPAQASAQRAPGQAVSYTHLTLPTICSV
eukprot:6899693-Alexandrium_andersonii.AAC.1